MRQDFGKGGGYRCMGFTTMVVASYAELSLMRRLQRFVKELPNIVNHQITNC